MCHGGRGRIRVRVHLTRHVFTLPYATSFENTFYIVFISFSKSIYFSNFQIKRSKALIFFNPHISLIFPIFLNGFDFFKFSLESSHSNHCIFSPFFLIYCSRKLRGKKIAIKWSWKEMLPSMVIATISLKLVSDLKGKKIRLLRFRKIIFYFCFSLCKI